MIDKSHFGTIEIFIYSERRENADYHGEKMIVVSAKIKKLWRVKVSGGESSHFEKNQFKVVRHILLVFFHSSHHYIQELCLSNVVRGSLNHFDTRMTVAGTKIKKM